MYIVRTFVGVDHFQVHQVARYAKFVTDSVTAHHVAGQSCDIQRLAATVAFQDAGEFNGSGPLVFHAAQAQAALQPQADFGQHVSQFFLDQLVGGKRAAKLPAVLHILTGPDIAVLSGTQRPPGAVSYTHLTLPTSDLV